MNKTKKLYSDKVSRYRYRFIPVVIPDEKVDKVKKFANDLVQEKLKEKVHQIDGDQEIKRHITGFMGEAALEELLGIDIIDYSIGYSKDYHHPDIQSLNVGIKTVEANKFPVIYKKNNYPQIICIKSKTVDNIVYVCGLADVNTLNYNQDDDLILNPKLRSRGVKTGFHGFKKLKQFSSLEELKRLLKIK